SADNQRMHLRPIEANPLTRVGSGMNNTIEDRIWRLYCAIPGRSGPMSFQQLAALARVAGTAPDPHPRWDHYRRADLDHHPLADLGIDVQRLGFALRIDAEMGEARTCLFPNQEQSSGAALRALRQDAGLDSREMARRTGLHPTAVNRVEGFSLPHTPQLGTVARQVAAMGGQLGAFACIHHLKFP